MPSDPQTATMDVASHATAGPRAHEMLTWAVLFGVYGAWLGLTYYSMQLPWWLLMAAGGFVVCLHGSLQHESVHGHLTGSIRGNTVLMIWPLAMWIPYTRYRTLHRAHHTCATLTDPVEDPESFYWTRERWQSLGKFRRGLMLVNQTLIGRLLIGPLLVMLMFWFQELKLIAAGDRRVAAEWLLHLAAAGVVVGWLTLVCELPLWLYLLLFVWPGSSLTLLRSFTEHGPGRNNEERTALIEGSFLTRLLFLNNNMHLVHHQHPELPWYAIRKLYLARHSEWLQRNGGYYFRSYLDVARAFLFRPKDLPVR